ncbi:MAG: endo alpha-1,4 polygalactosaminidase [Pseudomonadota bacterium]
MKKKKARTLLFLFAAAAAAAAGGCNGDSGSQDAADTPLDVPADVADMADTQPDVPQDVPLDVPIEADAPDAPADAPADDATAPEIWSPSPGTTWQWQLTDYPVNTSFAVAMYDIDLFDAPQETINALHADGRIVICYFSAGSYEDWREDASRFPEAALGSDLDDWEGEKWLDIRNTVVREIMKDRLDIAMSKECDGVEPDNVDGHDNDTGFDLSYADQLDYNMFLATEAHARGLSVGLKNDLDQVEDLVDHFDWALNEECFDWDECDTLLPFIEDGKAVFHVEYGGAGLADTICPRANELGFSTLIKNWDLDAWHVACW